MRTSLQATLAEPQRPWLQQHRRLIDVVLAVLVLGYDSMFHAVMAATRELSLPETAVAVACSVLMAALYVIRHRRLAWAFVGVLVAAVVQLIPQIGFSPAPVVFIGLLLYGLGAHERWQLLLPAVLASSAWAAVAGAQVVADGRARIGEVGMLVLAYVLAAVLGRLARARHARVAALQEHAAQLARERDARERVAAAEERARIAREMHDIISHSLGTMVVMADGAARTAEADPPQAGRAMARVRDTGREAMGEMRRMLDVLRDDDPASRSPQPGLARLDQLLDEVRASGLRVDMRVTGSPVNLPAGPDLAAYRIVQEALTNARKHGGPLLSLVTVELVYRDEALELRIADDGRGAAPPEGPSARAGHGLVGMRERVSAYGGRLEAGPRAAGGFEVHAVLPIGEDS